MRENREHKTAPVVLFVYKREKHTKQTIEALKLNHLSEQTHLYIYSDSAQGNDDEYEVTQVRRYIESIKGFRDVNIIYRNENTGLSGNIVSGINEILSEYPSAIILEDDIVTHRNFLIFMNNALQRFAEHRQVWHVNGWAYPISNFSKEAHFQQIMNCWGWATWADRWKNYSKDPKNLIKYWDKTMIQRFNLEDAENFFAQIEKNADNTINTWAIFWYARIFENNGLCLSPPYSLTENIGFDGSGVHCGSSKTTIQPSVSSFYGPDIELPKHISECKVMRSAISKHYRSEKKIHNRIKRKLNSIFKL